MVVYFEYGSDLKRLAKLFGDERARSVEELVVTVDVPSEQLNNAVKTVAASAPASIVSLTLCEHQFVPHGMATPRTPAVSAAAAGALWKALPDLRSLRLEGHAFFRELAHPTLESLTMVGESVIGSFMNKPADLPRLRSLTWTVGTDGGGASLQAADFKTLFAADGLPALRELNLSDAMLDDELLKCRSFLKGRLLSQLEVLGVPYVEPKTLKKAAPMLSGLRSLRLVDEDDEYSTAAPGIPITIIDTPAPRKPSIDLVRDEITGVWSLSNIEFRCYADEIEGEDVDAAVAALRKQADNEEVQSVSILPALFDTGADVSLLADALGSITAFRELEVRDPFYYKDGLRGDGVLALARAFRGHPNLRRLNLRRNPMGPAAYSALKALVLETGIQDLNVGMPGEGPDATALAVLVGAVGTNPALRMLNIDGVDGGPESGSLWAGTMATNTNLENLNVVRNRLGPQGVEAFSSGLRQNSGLVALSISGNRMGVR